MGNEVSFGVYGGDAKRLREVSLEEIGMRERQDLQRWISEYPEIVGPDLLLVTSEFDRWEHGAARVRDRLDVLFLDSSASLVVAELKRGEAPDTVDLQTLKYASYCAQLTFSDVVADYARFHRTDGAKAREDLIEHAASLEEGGLGPVKVRLVAEAFRPSVTSTVLWLRDYDLDIGCVEVSAHLLPDGNAVVSSRQLLPLPLAEDYLVRRRREREEEHREASARGPNVVGQLLGASAVEPGTEISLRLSAFTLEERDVVEAALQQDPEIGLAQWTGLSPLKALRWRKDGVEYSATRLILEILREQGLQRRSVPGPRYWELPTGESLAELAASPLSPLEESDP
ncbi:MAG: hypothetical protein M3P49_02460 [Actinomycetota bacterium]|nr:hypothetical protein [Actinomycetota bacterium]